ncbi:MAG: hypothetical protein ACRDEB_07665, partial [Chitinophagaceae bacterium]
LAMSSAAVFSSCEKEHRGQVWIIMNDATGETDRVLVKPFTYSGTFDDLDNSDGWQTGIIPGCSSRGHISMGGNIVHDGTFDRWDFVGMEGHSCSVYSFQGGGTGTTNAKYPDATTVSGTVYGTYRGPLGTSNVNTTWHGWRE